jgi:antitoxin component of MazEF toxin-antitoxin module
MNEAQDIPADLPASDRIPTLAELIAQITPENRYEPTDWGCDTGREIVEW